MTEQLDTQGEAREALSSMVTDYSRRVLSDPRMLRSLVTDLLPDLPRERNLLVTAAESDVAGELTRHVEEHHLDPDTAVQLVSRSLTEHTALDPAASTWVTTEYAQALGYRVRSNAPPPTPPPTPPMADPTITARAQYGPSQPPTVPQPDPGAGPTSGYPPYSQPQAPAGNGGHAPPQWPSGQGPAGVPAPGQPPWVSPAPPPKKKRNLGPILAAGGAALVAVIFFAVAAVAKIPPFSSSKPTPTPTPTISHHHPTPHPTPHPTGPTLTAGVAPLMQLLPSDVNPATCSALKNPGWANPGLVTALQCYDSGLSNNGDSIWALQMNSSANYQASLANFNTNFGFNPPSGSSCPPSGSSSQGSVPWNDSASKGYFPTAAGQIIECMITDDSKNRPEPTYVWTFPSEDAYIIAFGDPNTTFSALDNWWTNNTEPGASPKPASS
jgi:hypothetical protein